MSAGFWNVRGWNTDKQSDSYRLRLSCLEYLEVDILGLAETHLSGSNVLDIDGYSWFGNNRKRMHVNARRGSGGVGFLLRNDFKSNFDITFLITQTRAYFG